MRVVIDIEANSLTRPDRIHLIVCKDIDTGLFHIFRRVTEDEVVKERFRCFLRDCDYLIGHNWLGYDYPIISSLLSCPIENVIDKSIDTLTISKLVDYSRDGHSISKYGEEFGLPKIEFNDWTKWSQEMEDYCVRDVDICHKVYLRYLHIINDPSWSPSISLEQTFQLTCNQLHNSGFAFDSNRAGRLLSKVEEELSILDKDLLDQFPPKLKLIREITPKVTKHGTLSKTDFRFVKDGDLSEYNGGPFCKCDWFDFNPSSHKQIIQVLNEAGWKPVNKTKTHLDTEREINRLKHRPEHQRGLDLKTLYGKIDILKSTGWKVDEENLATLPPSAPLPARSLAKRILLESRRRTLAEWLGLVQPDGRVHGKFYAIGAWTHRMAHQQPNMANIPNEFKEDGSKKLYGKELRSLWIAPKKRLLVGVDAESIQLRVFAHIINDRELIDRIVNGRKSDKTDPHSYNKSVLGSACRTRQAAKRFLYALFLGGGLSRLASILDCDTTEAKEALDRLLERYSGFDYCRREIIPTDAERGWFKGLDGRKVRIPGDTVSQRKHLAMSGYLQSGEAIIMKKAWLLCEERLNKTEYLRDFQLVNLVHDEVQIETYNSLDIGIGIAENFCNSLKQVGEDLKLNCPLAGSYYNEDHKDYTIGINWWQTH